MDDMRLVILYLSLYHLIFFYRFYQNPYLLSTSEIASTFFPHWVWLGRQARCAKSPLKEEIYYKKPGSIPFLSTFYPPHFLSAILAPRNLDHAFRLFVYMILAHYLLASFIMFKVLESYGTLPALFGAITYTYAAYNIKLQTPCFVYTICWIPAILLPTIYGVPGACMALLSGYLPIGVYLLPVLVLKSFKTLLIAGVITSPLIVMYYRYVKRSVRWGQEIDPNIGKVPWWNFIKLIYPGRLLNPINGVHYPEMEMYVGVAILFIWNVSLWWVPTILAVLIASGLLLPFQRIPARSLYLLTLSLAFLSSSTLSYMNTHLHILLLLQALLLLRNSKVYPSFPFSQWWNRPSRLYHRFPKDKWPNFTGYLDSTHRTWYKGAYRLA